MAMDLSDWKLKLRYGRLKTKLSHFTLIADCEVLKPNKDLGSVNGRGFFAMKIWAEEHNEAVHMIELYSNQVGLNIDGKIQIYDTEPINPPGDIPAGYDPNFTPYD